MENILFGFVAATAWNHDWEADSQVDCHQHLMTFSSVSSTSARQGCYGADIACTLTSLQERCTFAEISCRIINLSHFNSYERPITALRWCPCWCTHWLSINASKKRCNAWKLCDSLHSTFRAGAAWTALSCWGAVNCCCSTTGWQWPHFCSHTNTHAPLKIPWNWYWCSVFTTERYIA